MLNTDVKGEARLNTSSKGTVETFFSVFGDKTGIFSLNMILCQYQMCLACQIDSESCAYRGRNALTLKNVYFKLNHDLYMLSIK